MSLPKWNNEWDQPDPLRGGTGWARHRYVNVAVAGVVLAVVLTFLIPCVLLPAVGRARRSEATLVEEYKTLQQTTGDEAGNSPRTP